MVTGPSSESAIATAFLERKVNLFTSRRGLEVVAITGSYLSCFEGVCGVEHQLLFFVSLGAVGLWT